MAGESIILVLFTYDYTRVNYIDCLFGVAMSKSASQFMLFSPKQLPRRGESMLLHAAKPAVAEELLFSCTETAFFFVLRILDPPMEGFEPV